MKMMAYIRFAWRNLWRNKRRTFITIASIFFGVILSIIMGSMQEGSYKQYIQNIVTFYSGYIQIQHKDYWDDKTINNTFMVKEGDYLKLEKIDAIVKYAPRLESYGLASSDEITKGVMIMGIEPRKENSITGISNKIVKGDYLTDGDFGVVLGRKLADYLKLDIHDTLVILGQGYHGVSAAGKYPVRGIISHPSPQFDKSVVYMNLTTAQTLYSADNRLSSIVIMIKEEDELGTTISKLEQGFKRDYAVLSWQKMNDILMKQIESDRSSGYIMKGILYMVIAFGIFGTITMMMAERTKEFGVLMAVGMQKASLSLVIFWETIFIGIIGAIAGIFGSIPIIYFFYLHPIPLTGEAAEMIVEMGFEPIMMFSMDPFIFYQQAITILFICIFIAIMPTVKIFGMKAIKALRE